MAFGSVAVVTEGAVGSTETWLPLPELAPIWSPPTVPTTELVIVVEIARVYVNAIELFAGTENGPLKTRAPESRVGSGIVLPPSFAEPASKLQFAGPAGVGVSRR